MDFSWGRKRVAEGSSLRSLRLLAILLFQVVLAFPAGNAVAQAPVSETEAIRALIMRGSIPELRHADFASLRQARDDSYRPGGYAPLWLAAGATPPILAELKDAPSHGLDPKDYDVAWLEGEGNTIAAGDRAPGRTARADVALTVSFFRLLSDLHDGRVSPERAGFKLDMPASPPTSSRSCDVARRRGSGTKRCSRSSPSSSYTVGSKRSLGSTALSRHNP
jgi:hypothetical protein